MFSITLLSFNAPSSGNPRKYPHEADIARNYSHWATSLLPIVWVHSNLRGGLRTTHVLCNEVSNGCSIRQIFNDF